MDPKPIKIFISYRRSDSPGHAGRLSDAFRNKYGKEQVFKDVTSIRGGAYFPSVIKQAIADASVMVVTIGPRWTGRRLLRKARVYDELDWIRQEIESALSGGTHILPVLVSEGVMPDKGDLPESLHFFADLNAVTVRDSRWEEDIEDVYKEIEQLITLPPITTIPTVVEKKVKKKRFSPLLAIGLSVLALLVAGYFIFKPFRIDEEPTKPQVMTGDWRSKIVMVSPRAKSGAKSTGFFISNNGHILTLQGPGEDSLFKIQTSDKKQYGAFEVLRLNLNGLPLVLLKSPLKNTPFIKFDARVPVKDLSIEILGVQGDTSIWKRYTARVLRGDRKIVLYERPEEAWFGMMGAPILDVSDEVAFGVHMGTTYDTIENNVNRKRGQGYCFKKAQVDTILKKARE